MSSDCIFCRIVEGKIPSVRVYEDADVIALLDIGPVSKGHALVIPRKHCNPINDVPSDLLQKLIVVVQKVVRAQAKGLGAGGCNVTQANGALAGQAIPHLHFHVIPRFANGEEKNWIPGKYSSPEEMNSYALKIRDTLA